MQRRSPPKHRHDGTSPLPLGMDWSPPPRKWNGRDTVWPHDPRTGWSYCVAIPSWVILPKSRDSDPVVLACLVYADIIGFAFINVFGFFFEDLLYIVTRIKVHVGVQSPEGVTTTRGVLRRFNDFLKLYSDLKKSFPKKTIPSTPPKGLLRMKSRTLLEERRCSLEEWMTKLLSDIDISRSILVASFLELEATARSSFQDESDNTPESNSVQESTSSSLPAIHGSSLIASDCGSDTAYETSDLGTPTLGRDGSFEVGLEDLSLNEDLTGPIEKLVKYSMSNIDEGLFMGHTILEQLEGLPRSRGRTLHIDNVLGNDLNNGNASKSSSLAGHSGELFSEQELSKVIGHVRRLSNESIKSDVSSLRGSEMSHPGIPNSSGNGSLDIHGGTEMSSSMEILYNSEMHTSRGGAQLVLPLDQRHKMNRLLLTMQRRLVTTKTDMEDLIARLNQETAVKEYLATKVNDLEVELETAKQKGRENLQQALSIERERFTQMQWDMEELRRKSLEMELKLKSEKDQKLHHESTESSSIQEEDTLMQELNSSKEQLDNVLKRYEELEAKSKADRKVLVKEVKSLRSFQIQLEHELSKSLKGKSEVEELLEQEKQKNEQAETDLNKLLHESKALHNHLRNCNLKFPVMDEDEFETSSLAEALDFLTTSDNQIVILLEEAELLGQDDRAAISEADMNRVADKRLVAHLELRKVLADVFIDSARLRKQVNSVTRHALIKDKSNKAIGGV